METENSDRETWTYVETPYGMVPIWAGESYNQALERAQLISETINDPRFQEIMEQTIDLFNAPLTNSV
jgi:hypothetical protein